MCYFVFFFEISVLAAIFLKNFKLFYNKFFADHSVKTRLEFEIFQLVGRNIINFAIGL